jgi:hypothetical protein
MVRQRAPLPIKGPDHRRKGWDGGTAVIIASGPSVREHPESAADLEAVRAARAAGQVLVIAVSDNYITAPWSDALFAADQLWWSKNIAKIRAAGYRGELWTGCNVSAKLHNLNRIRMSNRPGLGTYELHTGGNSGHMAINLAFLWGSRRMLLLGYDMRASATTGARHWFGDHPKPLSQVMQFEEWRRRFEQTARDLQHHGAAVINCSRDTALTCFPRSTIDRELPVAVPA